MEAIAVVIIVIGYFELRHLRCRGKRFGGAERQATPSNSSFTVTASSQKAIVGNSGRTNLFIHNTDKNNTVYLAKTDASGAAASVGNGIYLPPGGVHNMIGGQSNVWRGSIYAITDGGTAVITWTEEYA